MLLFFLPVDGPGCHFSPVRQDDRSAAHSCARARAGSPTGLVPPSARVGRTEPRKVHTTLASAQAIGFPGAGFPVLVREQGFTSHSCSSARPRFPWAWSPPPARLIPLGVFSFFFRFRGLGSLPSPPGLGCERLISPRWVRFFRAGFPPFPFSDGTTVHTS